MTHLVWVPGTQISALRDLPEGYEAAPIPDDPGADPHLGDVEILVVRPQDNLRAWYPQMRSLRLVQAMSAGVETQTEGFPEHLVLCSARGTHDIDVAEWVVGAILAGQRRFPHFRDEQTARRWSMSSSLRLGGSTVLLLGYGSIARAVEERLAPFGTPILRVARHARDGVAPFTELADLVGRADILVALCPLTPETEHLVSGEILGALPDNALVVNAARGAIVDGDALVAECSSGRLRACLDSTEVEPLPPDHPFYVLPNVFLTPHVAGATTVALRDVYDFISAQIGRYDRGEALEHVVDGWY
jgi:phosphoglycerate dehydrogenase-like enzyme